ncbi:MAG: aminotransferase class I/II-fold pyridoxal phosphate-dependent enzyme [Candidatus Aenigmatarchaeota archaeon]
MLAQRMSRVEYAIRDLVAEAQKLERAGKKVLYANIGDPQKYGFEPPRAMLEALHGAVHAGHNYYTDSEGDAECRQAIAERERRIGGAKIAPEDVIVTAGVSEAILFLNAALIEEGGEALLPGPGYPPYMSYANFFGGRPVFYRTAEENGWQPDISDVEKKITGRTKYLLVINPNNPTGAVYSKKTLKEIINLAGQHKLVLVADEVYDSLTFDKPFHSMAGLAAEAGVPIIVFNGLSKGYMATGWRLGWACFVNADEQLNAVKEAMLKLARVRLCAPTPVQKAAIPMLRNSEKVLKKEVEALRERRDFSYKRLNEIPGISAAKPEGAFYIFPKIEDAKWKDDKSFVLDLLHKKRVLAVHGSGFGGYGEGHFRIVFLPEVKILAEIYDRLEAFMKAQ